MNSHPRPQYYHIPPPERGIFTQHSRGRMMTARNFPQVKATGKNYHPEHGDMLPVFVGSIPSDDDNRVRLPDGTIAYVEGDDISGCMVLCKGLVALDAGDNVVRRFRADEQSSSGIAAPAIPHTSVYLKPIPDEIIGYLEIY